MSDLTQINIGLAGTGTVGSQLLKILFKNNIFSGYQINVIGIYARNPSKIQGLVDNRVPIYDKYQKLIDDSRIDVIVELIGGDDISFEIVRKSIQSKKTFVTANKLLLSQHWEEIFNLAKKNKIEIGFEAAVAGSIPIIKTLQNQLQHNQVKTISGILNGTANYILSKMESEQLDYQTALKNAQEKGFAESDPSFDLKGIDTAHKIYILSLLAFKQISDFSNIFIEGIEHIAPIDIKFSKTLGYRIKLLGIAQKSELGLQIVVQPVLLTLSHPLSSVSDEMNAIYYESQYSDDGLLVGKGAGGLCTASSVLSDIIYYGIRRKNNFQIQDLSSFQKVRLDNYKSNKYYLRFTTIDKAGVIAQISKILAEYNVSIYYIEQSEVEKKSNLVYIIILTHICKERNVLEAISQIDLLSDLIKQQTLKITLQD